MACSFDTAINAQPLLDQIQQYCLSIAEGVCSKTTQGMGVMFIGDKTNTDLLISSLCSGFERSDIPYNPAEGNRSQFEYEGIKLVVYTNLS